jgi:DsbC/DsbD-like thiol-disulfide interchange protein
VKLRRILLCLSLGLYPCVYGAAQASVEPAQWTGTVTPNLAAKPGKKITLNISAELREGWHVYGLEQPSGGPTPLRLTLDENDVASSAGPPSGSTPIKKLDQSFNLETQSYSHPFALHVPIQVKPHAPSGKQSVSISVRFQACNDRTCLPPRTVHLTLPIEILKP